MTKPFLLALAILGGFALAGAPGLAPVAGDQAEAAQSTRKKPTTRNFNQPRPKKKSYCGYPQEPNRVGMTRYCAFMYDYYCKRGVGCNKFGRGFMWDD